MRKLQKLFLWLGVSLMFLALLSNNGIDLLGSLVGQLTIGGLISIAVAVLLEKIKW